MNWKPLKKVVKQFKETNTIKKKLSYKNWIT